MRRPGPGSMAAAVAIEYSALGRGFLAKGASPRAAAGPVSPARWQPLPPHTWSFWPWGGGWGSECGGGGRWTADVWWFLACLICFGYQRLGDRPRRAPRRFGPLPDPWGVGRCLVLAELSREASGCCPAWVYFFFHCPHPFLWRSNSPSSRFFPLSAADPLPTEFSVGSHHEVLEGRDVEPTQEPEGALYRAVQHPSQADERAALG